MVIRAALLLLAGGVAAQYSRLAPSAEYCWLLLCVAGVASCRRRLRPIMLPIVGFAWFVVTADGIADARLEARFAGDSLLTTVRIVDFPQQKGDTTNLIVEPVNDARLPPRTRLSWFRPPVRPALGDVWQFELRLRRPRGAANPGGFDFEQWMFRERLHASGYVVNGKRNRLLASGTSEPLEFLRQSVTATATASTRDPASGAVLAAITSGTRHLIRREQWERYARTGTSHLMAISGLHVGLAAAAVVVVFVVVAGLVRLPGNALDPAMIVALAIAMLYSALSGFAVPAQRAAIMLAVATLVFFTRRYCDSMHCVAVAGIVVFALDPIATMTPGFWLSFIAVVVLVRVGQFFRPSAGNSVARVRQLIAMQSSLFFGLLTPTVLIFGRIALLAPVVNLLVVPIFSLVTVPFALAGVSIHPLESRAGSLSLGIAAASIALVESIVERFAVLPVADIVATDMPWPMCAVLLMTALFVVLPPSWPGRGVALIAVLAVVGYRPPGPPESCFDTDVLDVGQGLAVVVRTHEHTLVYDTGIAYRGGGSVARQILVPFLRYRGVSHVDWLVVSHGDLDHAGGVADLDAALAIRRAFSNDALAVDGLNRFACIAGQSWQVDGVDFRVLHPVDATGEGGNDGSCVLEIAAGDRRLLLTGDIETRAEEGLVARGALRSATVVLVPHHGSLTSSSPAFVNAVQPDYAIVSAGFANRWGFPKPAVVRRWQGPGAVVLNTATSGAVGFRLCADSHRTELREARRMRVRFWRDAIPDPN